MEDNINKVFDFLKNNKFNDAINSLNNIILNNQQNIEFYNLRAICYLQLSKYEKAKNDFDKVLSSKPSWPEIYNNLGILYFRSGQNNLAITNFLKSIEIKKDYESAIFGLIKSLAYSDDVPKNNSIFITKHNELNNIKISYSENEYIENITVENLLNTISRIISDNFINLKFNYTQIYRKTKSDLNCNRHMKVFNTYQAIPQYCFGCYKVQIEPENLIDLIKIYLLFDNIKFENLNTQKCMVETRPKIDGSYKSIVYCYSQEEAEIIKKRISKIAKKNLDKEVKLKVKRGCSEYGIKYPEYNNLNENIMKFKPEWKNYENLIDNNFPHLIEDNNHPPTTKGVTLDDALVIQNWLKYAILIGDETCKDIKSHFFKNEYLEKQLRLR